jgi:S1-C subfamily serine protease
MTGSHATRRARVVVLALMALLLAGALAAALLAGDDGTEERAEGAEVTRADINAIYRRLSPGVVFIQARVTREGSSPFGPPGGGGGVATGTGFVIDREGHVVTNAHVVQEAERASLRVEGEELVPARIVGADLSTDLAVLKVDPDDMDLVPLPLGDASEVQVGDEVLALGNPFGLEDTITSGIVSARQRRITAPNGYAIDGIIQTDAAVNPGNSGGPLVDAAGRVIGVNSQIATGGGSRAFAGIAFAVPVSTVREIVPDLLDDGRVDRPFLGVSTIDVTPSVAERLGLSVEDGAYVVAVVDGGPAQRAGIRPAEGSGGALLAGGDVIVRIGDREIGGTDDVEQAVLDQRIGDEVEIELVRAGERRTVTVQLAQRPRS